MATTSFFNDIVIKDKKEGGKFLRALERAEKIRKTNKDNYCDITAETIQDEDTIRKMIMRTR